MSDHLPATSVVPEPVEELNNLDTNSLKQSPVGQQKDKKGTKTFGYTTRGIKRKKSEKRQENTYCEAAQTLGQVT